MGVIYKIVNPQGRFYIGKAKDFRTRIAGHKHSQKKKSKSVILINSFRKYGFDEHVFEIIEECENSMLDEREIHWIKFFDSFNGDNPLGMNMTAGGDGQRGKCGLNDERRQRLRNNLFGKGIPFKGKKHTEEVKKQLSIIATERNLLIGRNVPKWGAEKGLQKTRKPILAYGVDGHFISEYISVSDASKKLSIKRPVISQGLTCGIWTLGKYKFEYKTDNYPLTVPIDNIRVKEERKPMIYYHKSNPSVIERCDLPKEASLKLNIPVTTIRRAALYNNGNPIRTGHIFFYEEDYYKQNPAKREAIMP